MTNQIHAVSVNGVPAQAVPVLFKRPARALAAFALAAWLLVALVLALWPNLALAAQDRYEYDPLGRLITHIDASGQATQYQYDAAGNILSVRRRSASELSAPQIVSVSPSILRRGQTRQVVIAGAHLQNVSVQSSSAELLLGNIQRLATSVTFDLSATAAAPLGPHPIVLGNLSGSATAMVTVAPALPSMSVEPSPLALPPTGAQHSVTVRLSNADVETHVIALASSDTTRLAVSPASVEIPPGQTTATFTVAGVASGFASLHLTSATLAPLSVPVFVTADFAGVNTSDALPVGVVVGAETPSGWQTSGPFVSAPVGVALGPVVTAVQPRALSIGDSISLGIEGRHLPDGAQVVIEPADGLDMGQAALSADRTRLQVPLSVAADAAVGARRLMVLDAQGQAIPMADAALSQLLIGVGLPSVASVEPLFGVGGTTVALTVRGRHLHGGVLSFLPAHDLIVEVPVVNDEGTVLTARVQVAAFAATGARTVRVVNAMGASTDQADAGNQFTVVQQIRENVTPIASPIVGVQVGQAQATQPSAVGPVMSAVVGLAVGPHARVAEPAVGVIGTTMQILIRGSGLGAVAAIEAVDAAGLSFGAVSANADGTELNVSVAIAGDAPRSLRRLRLLTAAGTEIPFIDPRFVVSAPLPQLLSVSPQVVPAGQTTALSLRGLRLEGVSAVRVEPAQGIAVSVPQPGADPDTQLQVSLQVAADAQAGQRTLIVTTAAGESSAEPVPGNTFQLAREVGSRHDAIAAPLVGVQVGSDGAPATGIGYLALSPIVGVTVQTAPSAPATSEGPFLAQSVGVTVGAVAAALAPARPDGFLQGSQGVLAIEGTGLQTVDQVVLVGASEAQAQTVQLGVPVPNAEGTRLQVPIHVAADAPTTGYRVQLRAAGQPVPEAAVLGFDVGVLPQHLLSTAPIVLEQGKAYTLTVRGEGLGSVYQVLIEGGAGVETVPGTFVNTADALGAFVQAEVRVRADAPPGSRVVRLQVPGGLTSGEPTAANTITIIAPQ